MYNKLNKIINMSIIRRNHYINNKNNTKNMNHTNKYNKHYYSQ